jgi:hypothetical protein
VFRDPERSTSPGRYVQARELHLMSSRRRGGLVGARQTRTARRTSEAARGLRLLPAAARMRGTLMPVPTALQPQIDRHHKVASWPLLVETGHCMRWLATVAQPRYGRRCEHCWRTDPDWPRKKINSYVRASTALRGLVQPRQHEHCSS